MSRLRNRQSIFRGRAVELDVDDVELPNGRVARLEIVRHPGGAAVVALDGQGRVCLLRQFRHAAGDWVREIPAGRLEPGEPPAETARRELGEEAGRAAARWQPLGQMLSSPGVFTERIHLFLARDLKEVPAAPEEHELFEVEWLPLASAVEQALRGKIEDAKTVVGLLRAEAYLRAGE